MHQINNYIFILFQVVKYTADHINGYQAEVTYEGEAKPYEVPRQTYEEPRQTYHAWGSKPSSHSSRILDPNEQYFYL